MSDIWKIDYDFLKMQAIFAPIPIDPSFRMETNNKVVDTPNIEQFDEKPQQILQQAFLQQEIPQNMSLHVLSLPYKEDERVYQLFVGKRGNNIRILEQRYNCRIEVRDKARHPHIKIYFSNGNLMEISKAIEIQLCSARDTVKRNMSYGNFVKPDGWLVNQQWKEIQHLKKRLDNLERIMEAKNEGCS